MLTGQVIIVFPLGCETNVTQSCLGLKTITAVEETVGSLKIISKHKTNIVLFGNESLRVEVEDSFLSKQA